MVIVHSSNFNLYATKSHACVVLHSCQAMSNLWVPFQSFFYCHVAAVTTLPPLLLSFSTTKLKWKLLLLKVGMLLLLLLFHKAVISTMPVLYAVLLRTTQYLTKEKS